MDDLDPIVGIPAPKNQRGPRILRDRTPWNRWSLQHIRKILPTTEVWRGIEPPWQLPEAAINLDYRNFINHQNQSTTELEENNNDSSGTLLPPSNRSTPTV